VSQERVRVWHWASSPLSSRLFGGGVVDVGVVASAATRAVWRVGHSGSPSTTPGIMALVVGRRAHLDYSALGSSSLS